MGVDDGDEVVEGGMRRSRVTLSTFATRILSIFGYGVACSVTDWHGSSASSRYRRSERDVDDER